MEILIAEDSPTQANQLRRLLEENGFEVTVASDGQRALEAARRRKPTLLLGDIMMPNMNGYELCQAIKADGELKDIPFILLTSLSSPEDVVKGLQCGADNFIKKPYNERRLLSRIDYILANRELRKDSKLQLNMEVELAGQKYVINSERQQILDLLVSTYEEAIILNEDLNERGKELANSYIFLHGLYRITEGLNQCSTEQEVARRALEHALELPNIRAGWIIRPAEGGNYRVVDAAGLPPGLADPQALEGECLCRGGLKAEQFPRATNIIDCERLRRASGETAGLRYHATVPLRSQDRLLGLMNLAGTQQGLFKEEDLKTLDAIGNQVAMALERAELVQNLGQAVAERTADLTRQVEQRKEIEAALRYSEEQTRLLLNSAAEAIYGIDSQGACTFANPSCLALLGFTDESQLLGKNMHELIHHSRSDRSPCPVEECAIYRAFKSGERVHVSDEMLWRADGTGFNAEIWSHPIGKDGMIIGAVVTFLDISERKRAQDALRETTTRLQLAMQASNIGPWDWNLRNNQIYFSPEWKLQIGYEDDELENRLEEWEMRLHPDDSERTLSILRDYSVQRRPDCEMEFRFRHKDGSYRWIFTKGSLLLDELGKPSHLLGCHVDVTERKSAEIAIAAKNGQIQLMQDVAFAANDSATLEDAARVVLERICAHTGWPVGHVYFATPQCPMVLESRGIWHLEDPARFQSFRRITESTQLAVGEGFPERLLVGKTPEWIVDVTKDAAFVRRQSGENLAVRTGFGVPVIVGEEAVAVLEFYTDKIVEPDKALLGVMTQVGSQLGRVAEREQAAKEKQLQLDRINALHEIDVAISSTLDLDATLNVLMEKIEIFLSYAACTLRLVDRESDAFVPMACRNLDRLAWEKHPARLAERDRSMVVDKQPVIITNLLDEPAVEDREFYERHGLVSFLCVPLVIKDEVIGSLGFYTAEEHEFSADEVNFAVTLAGQAAIAIHNSQLYERTSRQAAELAAANKIKSEFLSVMSHELRTPLNVIMGHTGMLQDGLFGELTEKQQASVRKVMDHSTDLLSLVNDILYVTQLEANQATVNWGMLDLEDFLGKLKGSYEMPVQNNQLELDWRLDAGLPILETDADKLKHVLQNLINNAVKFTEKGCVTVSARCQAPSVVQIEIADTGIGIAEEDRARIFEMFKQLDGSDTRKYGGIGVGLYIVKQYTDLLGGTVEVESRLGAGSKFTITLPIIRDDHATRSGAARCIERTEF